VIVTEIVKNLNCTAWEWMWYGSWWEFWYFVYISDGDLQNLLNNMSQQQLMQLFGGVGQIGGLSSLLGTMRYLWCEFVLQNLLYLATFMKQENYSPPQGMDEVAVW